MEERINDLQQQVEIVWEKLKIESLKTELTSLRSKSLASDFWENTNSAQETMKRIAKLEARISPWQEIKDGVQDLLDLSKLKDSSLADEIEQQLHTYEQKFNEHKNELKFNGQYDDHDAIVSIFAGAGGTDAQDWTQMLFRMYSRYFENNRWNVTVVDESAGDEAGLKSITIAVDGPFAYGKLRSENGVHRLVRLSPFNADHLRQTSFAKVEVMPKIERSDDLEIADQDLKIDVFRSGGHGGQSVNTTDSAVRVTHLPTNLTVVIQNERSQLQNKEMAMTILKSRLAQLQIEQHQEKLDALKGPNQSAEWGNQIRSYVLHPYKQVKDLRTKYETSDPDAVLDGDLDALIDAYLDFALDQNIE